MSITLKKSRQAPAHRSRKNILSAQHVMVLLSGGIDSAACVAFYINQKFSVSSLFIDYGQKSAHKERDATSAIATHYGIPLRDLKISGLKKQPTGYVIGRNAVLLNTALMALESSSAIVAIGIHAGTNYPDCSEEFTRNMQVLFDLYVDGRVIVGAPFLHWSKRDIWDYCLSKKVPVELTYSCELGKEQPCGGCLSCQNLETLHAG